MVLQLVYAQNRLSDLLKHRPLGPIPKTSGSVSKGQGLRIHISSKLPGDTDVTSLNHTLRITAKNGNLGFSFLDVFLKPEEIEWFW